MFINHQQILQTLSSSVFLLDPQLNIIFLNEAAEVLLEKSLRQVRYRPITESLSELESYRLLEAFKRCWQENISIDLFDVELFLLRSRKHQTLNINICIMVERNEKYMLVQMKEAHKPKIACLTNSNSQANQLMTRRMAHEIRNPLGGMRGAAQLLESELMERMTEYSPLTQYTEIIKKEADRLSMLVERIQYSTQLQTEQLNIHSILEHIRKLTQAETKYFTISTDYDPSLPEIIGDNNQLTQAFLNILKNAIEAVHSKKRLAEVTIKTRVDYPVFTSLPARQPALKVSIIDNGTGVPKDLIDHIFDPMVSGNASGTGVGLSITREIIHHHQGFITVQSEPGNTVFDVFLKLQGKENE